MNNNRRNRLRRVRENIESSIYELNNVLDEERDVYDNMPESFAGTDRYEESEASIDIMDEAICSLRETSDSINDIVTKNLV